MSIYTKFGRNFRHNFMHMYEASNRFGPIRNNFLAVPAREAEIFHEPLGISKKRQTHLLAYCLLSDTVQFVWKSTVTLCQFCVWSWNAPSKTKKIY